MRLTTFILAVALLQVSASTLAQKVTIEVNNSSLKSVFKELKSQTGYNFLYTERQLRKSQPVSVQVKNTELKEVLQEIFTDQPLTYALENKTIVIREKPAATHSPVMTASISVPDIQQQSIQGKVVDENRKPLVGATITLKSDPRIAVVTNGKGEFTLPHSVSDQEVVISLLGYTPRTQRVRSGSANVVELQVEYGQLEEVVITTGIFKKPIESFTGAATTVTAEELKSFGTRNLITSLRNIDPSFNIIENNAFGSDPNRLPEIQIRGNSSIPNVGEFQDQVRSELNTPLIILDGFQSSLQKLYDMNENEVETITILKDASATAMYGSRGANGVIVITTKPPQAGKLRLSFRSDANFEAPDLTGYSLLKAADKLELERIVGYYDSPRAELNIRLKRYYNYLLNEINSGVETDWLAVPLRDGVGQRHFLKVEGGDNAFRYSASGQFNDIQGVMKNSSRRTFNGNISLSYIYKDLKFRNNLQVQQSNGKKSPYGEFGDYVKQNPYWRPYDASGNALKFLGDDGTFNYAGGRWLSLPTNPLYNATLNTFDKSRTNELINNTVVEWSATRDLELRLQVGIRSGTVQDDAFRPAEHTAFANYGIDDIFRKGDYRYGIRNSFGYDGSINVAYNKHIGTRHLISAGMDYNMRQSASSLYSFLAEGFPNADFDFISMSLQYAKDGKPTGDESLTRAIGLTGNVNYSYANKYFVDASLRMDGSSQFGSKQRLAPFWSTGIGWNLHNEKFLTNNRYINRLKLRTSVGITGVQNFNAYQALSTFQYYTDDRYHSWMGSYLLGLGNQNLKWQQTEKYNIGVDAEFMDRRFRVTADYYVENTKDLVSSVNLPASSGFGSYIDNIGRLRNKGYEIKTTGFILNNPESFTWSVSAAFLHNKNKIIETSKALKDAQAVTLNGRTDPGTLYVEGYSSNTIWVVPSLGIDPGTGKELFLGKDGIPTFTWDASNIAAAGSRDPKLFGTFSSMLRYKAFAINASFRYTTGAQQYNSTLVDRVELTNYDYNVDSRVFNSRWQSPGDIAAFKSLFVVTPTYKSSRFVQQENTLVLQNVNFQYNVANRDWLKRAGLELLNVTLNAADPMYLSTIRRERGTSYPFSRQFSLSVNATF